jgi:hypothetical protein
LAARNLDVCSILRMRILMTWLRGMVVALAVAGQATAGVAPCSKRTYGEPMLTPDTAGPAKLAAVRNASFVRAELDFRPMPQVSPRG